MVLALFSEIALAVQIQGATSCGRWVEYEAKGNQNTEINFSRTWVVGYLSGLASASQKEFWGGGQSGVNNLDTASVFLWIDNYCRANPLKDIDDAAMALFFERIKNK